MRAYLQYLQSSEQALKAPTGQRLTLPLALEDGRAPHLVSRLALSVCGIAALVIVWAAFAQFRELAIAHGQIAPQGSVQVVQHLEGGLVDQVMVREGEIVDAGAAIVRLSPLASGSDFAQLAVRADRLRLQIIRLDAMLAGAKEPDFGALGQARPDHAREELAIFRAHSAFREREVAGLKARLAQRVAEVDSLDLERDSLERQLAIEAEQMEIRQTLLAQGYTSRRAFLESQSQLEQTRTRLIQVQGRLRSAEQGRREAQSLLGQAEAEAQKLATEERAKAQAELAELEKSLAQHENREQRLDVRAPVRGVIQELVPRLAGQVIKPGEPLARIVPLADTVVAEVRLAPNDAGHVEIGDPADVRPTAFDPALYGVAKGKVTHISPSTFTDERGTPYYKAIVTLDQPTIGEGTRKQPILPGMVVQADIITGSKSFIRYLLKPVYRSLDVAFSER